MVILIKVQLGENENIKLYVRRGGQKLYIGIYSIF